MRQRVEQQRRQWQAPPNWPQAPWGWTPPPGWAPLPEWAPAPDDWQFWVPVERRRKAFGWGWLAAHVVLLAPCLLTYYLTWEDMGAPGDGAVGVGGIATPLIPLGLPWNIPAIIDPDRVAYTAEPMPSLYYLGPAVLNLILHLAYRVRRWRRRQRPADLGAVTPLAQRT